MAMKILVINMLHIGDLLLATPVLRTLRANYPDAHIALLADAKIDDLVRYNKNIDELISVDKKGYHNKLSNYLRLIRDIRRRKFDLVINLHPNERASALAAFSGARRIVGYSSPGFGFFFDTLINNQNFDHRLKNRIDIPHQADEHLEMLENVLGLNLVENASLEMWLDDATIQKTDSLWFSAFGNPTYKVIGFNTGASWPTKRWTTEGFAEVADHLLDSGYGVAFFGGPMDEDNVREIQSLMRNAGHPRIAVFTGRISLLELAGLIRKCSVFLTNDSGPMHVAVAQEAKVVAIFGSSNEVGFGPYDREKSVIVTTEGVDCRPCGQHNCDHHSCMKKIASGTVLNHVVNLAGANEAEVKPAVFFDRDGVLNKDKGYTYRPDDFEWMPGAIEAVRFFNERGYHVFVVTNQSGVARSYYREEDVQSLHRWMNSILASHGAHIDGFYYCPHHPGQGDGKYRQVCQCRKPEPGLIRKAMEDWKIDPEQSFLIGDKDSDVEAAHAAGITGHLFTGTNLLSFVRGNCNK